MAIRLRVVNGECIAVCAARSIPRIGDIYLDDGWHDALSHKFAVDFNEMFQCGHSYDKDIEQLVQQEESNNLARDWWDKEYGTEVA